jgi:putative membrane protein
MKLTTISLATACVLLSAPVFAQSQTRPQNTLPQATQPQTTQPQTTGVAPVNAAMSAPDFVNKIVMGDMWDVRTARLAEQKGDNGDKSFARREVTDHTKLTDDLKAMVDSGKVKATIPTGWDNEHQQRFDQLEKLSGKPFDEAYNRNETQNHQNMVNWLQQYAQNGDNAELKQWASKTLPEVKQHLTNAEKLK